MKIIKKIEIDLIQDREILKYRVNMIGENTICGWLKPAI